LLPFRGRRERLQALQGIAYRLKLIHHRREAIHRTGGRTAPISRTFGGGVDRSFIGRNAVVLSGVNGDGYASKET